MRQIASRHWMFARDQIISLRRTLWARKGSVTITRLIAQWSCWTTLFMSVSRTRRSGFYRLDVDDLS
jgi:hypothetical protein